MYSNELEKKKIKTFVLNLLFLFLKNRFKQMFFRFFIIYIEVISS